MSRDFKLYLDDMIDAVTAIQTYTTGYDYQTFVNDQKTVDAVLHNLAIIGEAATKLSSEIKNEMPEIEWRKIIGLRNIVIHEYFGVDQQIVWDIIANKLQPLAEACRRSLKE
jgi:uncharacterized protein with HEPN domain